VPAVSPSEPRVLAVVPARGGSKGLPGKNLRLLAGVPLIEHAIRFAAQCPQIERTVVSTDSPEIAAAAEQAGAEVPFLRPHELAADDTPMWPVLRHALAAVEGDFDLLVLLDPTAPVREPDDLTRALAQLAASSEADGVVSVSEPGFNPVWQCVVERNGFIHHLVEDGSRYTRRQDAPRVLVVNGLLYVWRTSFVEAELENWFHGRLLPLEVPPQRAITIDTPYDLDLLEALVTARLVSLPGHEVRPS
jgi:N-acylneuraminate cytidylyltransferase